MQLLFLPVWPESVIPRQTHLNYCWVRAILDGLAVPTNDSIYMKTTISPLDLVAWCSVDSSSTLFKIKCGLWWRCGWMVRNRFNDEHRKWDAQFCCWSEQQYTSTMHIPSTRPQIVFRSDRIVRLNWIDFSHRNLHTFHPIIDIRRSFKKIANQSITYIRNYPTWHISNHVCGPHTFLVHANRNRRDCVRWFLNSLAFL